MPVFGDMFSMSLTWGAWQSAPKMVEMRNGDSPQVPTHELHLDLAVFGPNAVPLLICKPTGPISRDPVKVGNAIRLAN